jgi:hypothetical protein
MAGLKACKGIRLNNSGAGRGGLMEWGRAGRHWGPELHGQHGEYSAFIVLV